MKSNAWLLAAAAVWFLGILFGVETLRRYESTPGHAGSAPAHWPGESRIDPPSTSPALVMLVHPQCSCTAASLDELEAIMAQAHGALSAWVLFARPMNMPQGWERSATWAQAQRIPGVTVRLDPDGKEATLFGALTSGEVVLYDRHGTLIFSGGITGARGHVGDNVGRRLVLAILVHGQAAAASHEVYGCAL
jgi:hypothetical protein